MQNNTQITTFDTGKSYTGTFIGDSDLHHTVKIERRTASSVWIYCDEAKKTVRKKLHLSTWNVDHYEFFYPFGQYSMAMTISAERVAN